MSVTGQFQSLCGSMFKSRLKWICSGVVPPQLCTKHKCWYMTANDPYSIFQSERKNSSYLLFFRYLAMPQCETILLVDLHNILCVNEYNETINMFFGFSLRFCYNTTMIMTTDLREHCGARDYETDLLSGYYYVNDQTKPEESIHSSRGGGCGLLGSPTLVLCLLLSLVLVLCLRWRAAARLHIASMDMNFYSILYFGNSKGRNRPNEKLISTGSEGFSIESNMIIVLLAAALALLLLLRWR